MSKCSCGGRGLPLGSLRQGMLCGWGLQPGPRVCAVPPVSWGLGHNMGVALLAELGPGSYPNNLLAPEAWTA